MSRLLMIAAALAAAAVLIAFAAVEANRRQTLENAALLPAFRTQAADPAATGAAAVDGQRARADLPLPQLRLDYQPALGVKVSGQVPDEQERQTLLQRLQALYGAGQVHDQLQVAAVANPAWLSPAYLPDLRGMLHARALLVDARLSVEGAVSSLEQRQALSLRLASIAAAGLQVVERVTVHTDSPAAP